MTTKRVWMVALLAAGCGAAREGGGGFALEGQVLTENGEALPGAQIVPLSAEGVTSATADADGRFSMPVDLGANVFRFSAPGYGTAYLRRELVTAPFWITAQLRPAPPAHVVEMPVAPDAITVNEELVSLTIPGGSLCLDGRPVTGQIEVAIIPYDPRNPRVVPASPVGPDGLPNFNLGMMDLAIEQAGAPLDLCADQTIEIKVQVPSSFHVPNTDDVALSALDTRSGFMVPREKGRFDPATSTFTANTRQLFPHCPHQVVTGLPPQVGPEVAAGFRVLDTRGKPTTAQLNIYSQTYGLAIVTNFVVQNGTMARYVIGHLPAFNDQYCDVGVLCPAYCIAAVVTPAPRPDQDYTMSVSQPQFYYYGDCGDPTTQFSPGQIDMSFQYCVRAQKACAGGELCCGGLTCKDGRCGG